MRWQTQEFHRHHAIGGYVFCELCDVERETCGLYTAGRQPKALGYDPADINAQTVVIFDLIPIRPGADFVAEDGMAAVSVRLSHHGATRVEGTLAWGWTSKDIPHGTSPISVPPHETTAPVPIRLAVPERQSGVRLHVWMDDTRGQRRAYGFLDIAGAPGRSR